MKHKMLDDKIVEMYVHNFVGLTSVFHFGQCLGEKIKK